MRIAILGSAPSSVHKAPLKNSIYDQWLGGRLDNTVKPPESVQIFDDYEIWACSPGAWAVTPRIDRFFEVHRFEPGQPWFTPDYSNFLQTFRGPVYTGAHIPAIPNHVVYPIDVIEEKFSSYFLTSSIALMMAYAIYVIEKVRRARKLSKDFELPPFVDAGEIEVDDKDDTIGLWGVDMSASEEWGYQRAGCQFFLLEVLRRNIGLYLPPESDLARPQPVYGISEWDDNYIKLTARARELNQRITAMRAVVEENTRTMQLLGGEMSGLNYFVNTWTNPYGMMPGMVLHQNPDTGLGSGITHLDSRPVQRMMIGENDESPMKRVVDAMAGHQDNGTDVDHGESS